MCRQNQRYVPQLLQQAARKVCVPSVAVHDVDIRERARHDQILQQRREQFRMPWVTGRDLNGRLHTQNLQIPLKIVLIAKTQHPDRVFTLVERGELSGEILDMHAGAAVDVRRVSFVNTAIVIVDSVAGAHR